MPPEIKCLTQKSLKFGAVSKVLQFTPVKKGHITKVSCLTFWATQTDLGLNHINAAV